MIDPQTRDGMKKKILHYLTQTGLTVAGLDSKQLYLRLQEEILYVTGQPRSVRCIRRK